MGQRINVPVNSSQIDLKNQKSGIYFVEVKTNKETYRGRIVKTD
ncbi:MAG: T9SS type A sorting domain-containing protein [Bacteroidetes bacterium]|nr:MAG: T9SS type A sorting domain-containing protein [Bacteroidota bacterium]